MHVIQTFVFTTFTMFIWKRIVSIAAAICMLLTLTGCAGMNAGFNCPMKPGHMCSSLDQVNRMVDQGKIGGNARHTDTSDTVTAPVENRQDAADGARVYSLKTNNPWRDGESVLRIWVAPFEDKAGTYHSSSRMYALLRPGQWVDSPVSVKDHE